MQITVYSPQKGRLETIDAELTKDIIQSGLATAEAPAMYL